MLFEVGRKEGRFVIREKQKRQGYSRTTLISEPTQAERDAFIELQKVICTKLMIHHPNPNK